MPTLKLSTEQLARLIYKSRHEPRRNQKRYLKDLGGEGSAEELDAVLAKAERNKEAVTEADRLDKHRRHMARATDLGMIGQVAEMIADVRLQMEQQGVTQQELAERCGWAQPLANAYLTGNKEPGISNLAKMAKALGCAWRLKQTQIP